ncbi:MAG: membrane protein insertase YidC, partial [Acidobacteria bacterium]|nr:membrane protein insertase YidC [Acidobacteriota bacterium]
LLAFVLSFAVLWAFRAIYAPPAAPVPETAEPAKPSAQTPSPPVSRPDPDAPRVVVELAPPAPGTIVRAEKPEDVVVENMLYSATISNVGGVLKSYTLHRFTDAEAKPVELIDAKGGEQLGWPLAVVTGDAAIDETLSKAQFVTNREGDRIQLEFAEDGLHARKSVDFSRANYEFIVETSLTKDGKGVSHSIVWQGGFGDQSIPYDAAKHNAIYQAESAFERLNVASVEGEQTFTTERIGTEDQYFLAMFLHQQPHPGKVSKKDYTKPDEKVVSTIYLAGPQQTETATRIYAGPKDEGSLRDADPNLVAVIDYGMFEFLARPLMLGLLWINSYVGNFGWSIVIFTVILNFILFPLRLKQQMAMQKMQKIQPHMKTLQDKYKKLKANDPRRAQVQQEMMGLYKQHGVNPLGGCLPLLLQMPFFFAILSILSVAIELRRAPWILWITDLSRHDPYYILPILFAVTMIITQKMTPTTVDPAQAKMMMIMPVMLTFMFLWVSSGLALYWTSSNVVGIGQQYFINKFWSSETAKSKVRPKDKASSEK